MSKFVLKCILFVVAISATSVMRADFLFWLDSPTGRNNSHDPKSQSFAPTPTPCPLDGFDPGDDFVSGADSLVFTNPSGGASFAGVPTPTPVPGSVHSLAWPCDVADWYKVSYSANSVYSFFVQGRAGDQSGLALYDDNMTLLVAVPDGARAYLSYTSPVTSTVATLYLKHSIESSSGTFLGSVVASIRCVGCPFPQSPKVGN